MEFFLSTHHAMNNKDYNLDNYTNDELFEIFAIDEKKGSMINLKQLDTFMKKFLSKSNDEDMREFMQNAGKKVIKIYLTNLQDLTIQEMLSIFNISYPVSNIMNMEYEAKQIIEKKEGYVRIYLDNVLVTLIDKLATPEIKMTGQIETIEQSLYLDTRFRENVLFPANGTIFHLPEIKHVISLQLNYIEVPLCWKLFDKSKQNNFFLIDISSNKQDTSLQTYSIEHYKAIEVEDDVFSSLVDQSNDKLILDVMKEKLHDKIPAEFKNKLYLKNKGNKLYFESSGNKYIHIVFHDASSPKFAKVNINQTLGWKLGFRKTEAHLHSSDISKNFADAFVSLHPRTLFLQLDDYTSGSSEHPVILPISTHQDRHNDTFRDALNSIHNPDKPYGDNLKVKQFLKANEVFILDHIHIQTNKKKYIMLMRNEQYRDAGDLIFAVMDHYKQKHKSFHLHHKDTFAVIDLHKTPIDSLLAGQTLTEYYDDNDFTKMYTGVTLSKIRLSILDEHGDMVDFQGEDFKVQLKLKKNVQPNVVYSKYTK